MSPGLLLRVGALGIVMALLVFTHGGAYRHGHSVGSKAVQARWDADVIVQQRRHEEALVAARSVEQRRIQETQKAADEAKQALTRARADAAAAADAGQRLRQRIAALATASCAASGDPAAAGSSTAAHAAADLLADLQRRLDEATDSIARFADESHASGAACERIHNALTPGTHGRS